MIIITDKNEYCSLKVSLLAYNKGFNLKCPTYYIIDSRNTSNKIYNSSNLCNTEWDSFRCDITNNISAPTKYMLYKWLLTRYNINIVVSGLSINNWTYSINNLNFSNEVLNCESGTDFKTADEAWEEAFMTALYLIKNK